MVQRAVQVRAVRTKKREELQEQSLRGLALMKPNKQDQKLNKLQRLQKNPHR
jgi:hypothetical protein